MPKNTKKSERAALAKARRKVRTKMKAHQASKRKEAKTSGKTHPHRRTSALRARR